MPSHSAPQPTIQTQPSAADQARLAALGQALRQRVAAGDFAAALEAANAALDLAPGHPVVLADIGLCRMRLGDYEAAFVAYEAAQRAQPEDECSADGLVECSGLMGRLDRVATLGCRALTLKAAQVANARGWPLPAPQPPAFDANRPERNVVSFSLFGADPRYCETAVLNVDAARRLLPGWRCRFHLDASVPLGVRRRLAVAGAQLVEMDNHPARAASPLMWRFLVLDDPGVDRYLLRDADSLLSEREVGAITAWLASDRWFHLMRDCYTHSELLLAGMWGGCGGVFRDVAAGLVAYSQRPPRLAARLIDQHWLRSDAWPTVRQSVLSHDSVFGWQGGLPFPPHAPVDLGSGFHVGGNICFAGIGGKGPPGGAAVVHWRLLDAQGAEVCSYATPVRSGRWSAQLPQPYIRQLQAGGWRCQVRA